MTDETLLALAERCEREAPSFELDRSIMYAVHCVPPEHQSVGDKPKCYTTSIDAAVTLVPPNHDWRGGTDLKHGRCWAVLTPYDGEDTETSDAATPALALCSASLKARAALLENER